MKHWLEIQKYEKNLLINRVVNYKSLLVEGIGPSFQFNIAKYSLYFYLIS